jgi:hypothetical protein
VGAWAALVLGADGGPGTQDLCRPLSLRPDAFDLVQTPGALALQIAIACPNQDITRAFARIRGEVRAGTKARALSAAAEKLVSASVTTLLEPLRGLGGEASTSMAEVRVSCSAGTL